MWAKMRDEAKVVGRWHDNRQMLVTELSESGAGDEVILCIAGHVSAAIAVTSPAPVDGSEAARPRRNRRPPVCVRQEAQEGRREAEAGRDSLPIDVGSVIAGGRHGIGALMSLENDDVMVALRLMHIEKPVHWPDIRNTARRDLNTLFVYGHRILEYGPFTFQNCHGIRQ